MITFKEAYDALRHRGFVRLQGRADTHSMSGVVVVGVRSERHGEYTHGYLEVHVVMASDGCELEIPFSNITKIERVE